MDDDDQSEWQQVHGKADQSMDIQSVVKSALSFLITLLLFVS